jgi:hypothetical protein
MASVDRPPPRRPNRSLDDRGIDPVHRGLDRVHRVGAAMLAVINIIADLSLVAVGAFIVAWVAMP